MKTISFNFRQYLLLICPPVLLISTFSFFRYLATNLEREKAYRYGFLFYWVVWCLFIPLATVGLDGLREMFREPDPRFGKPR